MKRLIPSEADVHLSLRTRLQPRPTRGCSLNPLSEPRTLLSSPNAFQWQLKAVRPAAQRCWYDAYLSIIPAIWPVDWLTDEAFCRHSIIQPSVLSLQSVLKLPACLALLLALSLSLSLFEEGICSKCFLSSSVAPVVSVSPTLVTYNILLLKRLIAL